jgi:hypothetical protein
VEGNWREGSFTGGPKGHIKEGSGDVLLSPNGTYSGNWRRGVFTGEFERVSKRGLCQRSDSLYENVVRVIWREGSFTGNSGSSGNGAPVSS